jgi:hypothetical protein
MGSIALCAGVFHPGGRINAAYERLMTWGSGPEVAMDTSGWLAYKKPPGR